MALRDAFMKFPVLETENYVLKQLGPEYADAIYELYAEPEVIRYLDWDGPGSPEVAKMVLQVFQDQYRKREALRWGIFDKTNQNCIGTCILGNFRKNMIADLGYDLAKPHWGKGIMKEVLGTIIAFCDQELGLHRIQAYVRPENEASSKLLLKLGFEKEGLLRQWGYHETLKFFYDVLIYARVR